VQSSAWLTLAQTYPWTLVSIPGVHYMEAWAADRASNVSLMPAVAHINLLPTDDALAQGQVRLYRQTVSAGETLSVTVTPHTGDPDLYIWPPAGDTPRVSDNATGPEHLSIAVTESGTYQIEVYGYTAATYAISIEVTAQAGCSALSAELGPPARGTGISGLRMQAANSKVRRTAPVVSPSSTPQTQIALPPAAPIQVEVEIDIKPGSYPNCFNNDGNGVIPVAILGSEDFDVHQVDVMTLSLEGMAVAAKGKADKLLAAYEDVNGDGHIDLVIKIEDVDGVFEQGTATATLSGQLLDGTPIEGTDEICITQ
jgi:hypothetical protein